MSSGDIRTLVVGKVNQHLLDHTGSMAPVGLICPIETKLVCTGSRSLVWLSSVGTEGQNVMSKRKHRDSQRGGPYDRKSNLSSARLNQVQLGIKCRLQTSKTFKNVTSLQSVNENINLALHKSKCFWLSSLI